MKPFRWLLTLVVLGGLYGGAYLQGQQPPTLMYGLDISTKLTHPINVDSQGNLGLAGTFSGAVAGSLTNNGAVPGATNIGVLSVLANAASPTWTEGRLVTLSADLTGALRVSGGGGGLQYTLGATTAGESGNLILGAVTTAAPTYTTAQTNALSLTPAGSVRVDVMNAPATPFPAASALSDAQANPTTPLIGAALMGFNGTTWDRLMPGLDYTQDAALTPSSTTGSMMMGRASAAAPLAVSNDDDAVMAWHARTGALMTMNAPAGTATLTNISGSASSVTLVAANTSRRWLTCVNDSSATLYLKFGTTASTTSFSYKMSPNTTFEMGAPWSGIITGIWDSATGSARCTELAP